MITDNRKMKNTFLATTLMTAVALTLGAPAHAAQPDLTVKVVRFIGGVKEGSCNTVRISVYNKSTQPVAANFNVALVEFFPEAGLVPLKTRTIFGGIGGRTAKSTTMYNVPYYAYPLTRAWADSGQTVDESNENNNLRNVTNSITGYCSKISISDASAKEGYKMKFKVTVSPKNNRFRVTVGYVTKFGTAKGGSKCDGKVDFVSRKGKLTFTKGQSTKTIGVKICKDLNSKEAKENFKLVLGTGKHAEVVDGEAIGTILVPNRRNRASRGAR